MGQKGDKLTNQSTLAAEALLEKLSGIENVTSKKMFGGHGIFHEKRMFGMITAKGGYYFKADESNKPDFEKYGAEKHSRMPYYTIPDKVMENDELLNEWAKKAIEASKLKK